MDQMIRETLDSAKEKLKHTNIILEDMMKNKKEYSSRDLSWRNLDLLKAMVLAVNELTMVVEEMENKPTTTVRFIENDDDEEDESYDNLNIEEDEEDEEEKEDMGEYPDQELEEENEEFERFLDEDEEEVDDDDLKIDSDEIEEIEDYDEDEEMEDET